MMGFLFYTTIGLFIFVCFCMILLILIQKGRGGGLASAFGGAGGNTAFGSKTGDVLTWATSVVFGVFILLAVALNLFADSRNQAAQTPQAQNVTPASGTGVTSPLDIPLQPQPAPVTQPAAGVTTPPTTLPSTVPATDAPGAKPQATTGPATAPAATQTAPGTSPAPAATGPAPGAPQTGK
jgi:preprotein translocase subunit SecG